MRESERAYNAYYGTGEDTGIQSESRVRTYGEAGRQKVNCVQEVLKGKHVLVVGDTGSGKTYWMASVCKFLPSYIFVNPQEEEIVDKITQVVTEDENEVIKLLEEGYRRIQFLPSEDDLEGVEQLKTIRLDLWEVAREMNIKDGMWWMHMIIDEAQIYGWLGSRTDIQNFARRGRRYGVKSFFMSQAPQDLAKPIVNNCEFTILFELGTFSIPYYQRFHIPMEEEKEWVAQKHHYVVWDKKTMMRCDPV